MGPDGPRLPVSHKENALVKSQKIEGKSCIADLRVVTDPRTALDSVGDEDGRTPHRVVGNVVESHHFDRVGPCFPIVFVAQNKLFVG